MNNDVLYLWRIDPTTDPGSVGKTARAYLVSQGAAKIVNGVFTINPARPKEEE